MLGPAEVRLSCRDFSYTQSERSLMEIRRPVLLGGLSLLGWPEYTGSLGTAS